MEPDAQVKGPDLDSWRALSACHQPAYQDEAETSVVLEELSANPPLVFAGEADKLRDLMAAAGRGDAFVLQGGDCAETFAGSNADQIRNKIRTILQMAVVLTYGASVPVVKIGRMAGQYAKPRSSQTETRDGMTLPSYLGDAVNSHEFTPEGRRHDPHRLLECYHRSATTLNLMRAFTWGGFADLRSAHAWNAGFTKNPAYKRYEKLAQEIDRAMRFMIAAGADVDALKTVDFYSSHEALLLEYERALTRIDHRTGEAYTCSGHFLWIGERTRDPEGAHVELLSKVRNPIGVKIGPTASGDELLRLIDRLNPDGEAGRLSFITRMGSSIEERLPALIEAVKRDGRPVTWLCDPMHGNTFTSVNGYKTRRMADVIGEVHRFFEIHQANDSIPAGLHVELTGDDVTEVIGGSEEISEEGLARRYETLVDPRLNHQQALELAFDVAGMIQADRD